MLFTKGRCSWGRQGSVLARPCAGNELLGRMLSCWDCAGCPCLLISCAFSFPVEIWRRHLEAYSRCALEMEESLEASTSQMRDLNL